MQDRAALFPGSAYRATITGTAAARRSRFRPVLRGFSARHPFQRERRHGLDRHTASVARPPPTSPAWRSNASFERSCAASSSRRIRSGSCCSAPPPAGKYMQRATWIPCGEARVQHDDDRDAHLRRLPPNVSRRPTPRQSSRPPGSRCAAARQRAGGWRQPAPGRSRAARRTR